jgi:WS/DGAT/MGAT family acyltransferase
VLRGVRAGAGAARHPRRAFEQARAAAELVVREEVIPAPATSLNRPLTGARRYAAVRFDLADLKAVREHRGGTLNDVVLALCAGGLRRLLLARGETPPAGGVRAQVPVNVRGADREHALGNELTSLFVELPVDEADPLIRYERLRRGAREHKQGSERAGGRAIVELADLGPPLAGGLVARSMFGAARMFNLTVTNVPGPRERFYAFGAPLVDVLPLVPLFSGHTVGIAVVSYAGGIEFGLNADPLAVPDLDVLVDGIRASLGELRGRGRPAGVSAGARAPAA